MSEFENYYILDDPIPYKNLLICPVLMKDYIFFHENIDAFLFNKNRIPDANIIQMSYFEFLWSLAIVDEESINYLSKAFNILKLCLKVKTAKQVIDKSGNFFQKLYKILFHKTKEIEIIQEVEEVEVELDETTLKPYLIINGQKYTKNDFKHIRRIICEQNLIELPEDNKMNPEMEKVLMEAQAYYNRTHNHFKVCSLEDQIICVQLAFHFNTQEIKNVSIRKFQKYLQRADLELHYRIYKTAEMSGMVTFKKPPQHWMAEIKHEKYADVIMDADKFGSKFGIDLEQKIENNKVKKL